MPPESAEPGTRRIVTQYKSPLAVEAPDLPLAGKDVPDLPIRG